METQYSATARFRCVVVPTGGLVALCLLILFPLAFASLNALALSAWIVLQLLSIKRSRQSVKQRPFNAEKMDESIYPFFSIHVPSHNEPPDVVCRTLDALAQIKYPHFEVIVIDNNTSDRALWEPVARRCFALGSRFTFLHRMNVIGAKAGALNIARRHIDSRTDFIVTVDADYTVSDTILDRARSAIQHTGADYVQFPQAYKTRDKFQQPLVKELGDYFDRHAQSTLRDSSMLLTGTLSVVSIDALDQAGGWPTRTITEDAELGIKLQRHSFHGVFINCDVGRGLLPPSASELRKQRNRWITGNVQVLISTLRHSPRTVLLSHILQLSAWCSFIAIPYLLSILLPVLSLIVPQSPEMWYPAMTVGLVSILAQMVSYLALSRTRPGFFGIKWALALSSSWASLFALAGFDTKFRCTRRIAVNEDRATQYLLRWYSPLIVSLVCSVLLNWWSAVVACTLLVAGAFHYLALDSHLKQSQRGKVGQPVYERSSHVI